MSGFRLLLAKLASVALLDTLTPKDYFYVVSMRRLILKIVVWFVQYIM